MASARKANLGERRATARVVDDVRHDAPDVVVPLRVVHEAVFGSALTVRVVGREHGPTALALGPNDSAPAAVCRKESLSRHRRKIDSSTGPLLCARK